MPWYGRPDVLVDPAPGTVLAVSAAFGVGARPVTLIVWAQQSGLVDAQRVQPGGGIALTQRLPVNDGWLSLVITSVTFGAGDIFRLVTATAFVGQVSASIAVP